MLTQNQIKHIRSLQQKKFRNEHKQFTAEAPKIIEELIESKFSFNNIYAKKEWLENNSEKLKAKQIPYTEINNKELERISGLVTPNSVLAVLDIPEDIIPSGIFGKELILILDEIKDPGNLGSIIRTADWFGINNIICSENTVDVYNLKVVQATMGSVARVNVYYTDLVTLLKENAGKAPVYGTFMNAGSVQKVAPEQNGVIIIGMESSGIRSDLLPYINHKISVPQYRTANDKKPESLNAAVAAAIMCYEFRRG